MRREHERVEDVPTVRQSEKSQQVTVPGYLVERLKEIDPLKRKKIAPIALQKLAEVLMGDKKKTNGEIHINRPPTQGTEDEQRKLLSHRAEKLMRRMEESGVEMLVPHTGPARKAKGSRSCAVDELVGRNSHIDKGELIIFPVFRKKYMNNWQGAVPVRARYRGILSEISSYKKVENGEEDDWDWDEE